MSEKTCKAPAVGGPCVLPAGHNMGYLDVPSQHWAGRDSEEASYVTLPELTAIGKFSELVELAAAELRKSDISLGDIPFYDANGDLLGTVTFAEQTQFHFSPAGAAA